MNDGMPTPSAWVQRYAGLIPQGGTVLDLACGRGRHTRFFVERGHRVVAADMDVSQLGDLAKHVLVSCKAVDLENAPWPFENDYFAGIVVVNYLHRPHFPLLIDALAEGGVLLFDTFAVGQEHFGRPRNPEFLLKPGELLDAFGIALSVQAYACGEVAGPPPAVRQRICAIREPRGLPASSSAASERP